ncbi:response regulator [Ancylobacter rudongensis]|uniref:Response regulator receiver domain-containing protein n=1 Tax=Ancylobacter rudongensis TaxID=177413 RepID=A0A1G4RTI0_9HYPH|nr:response regulator [Ancylobacter rudongensis]SCW59745.1 Response regulator receiver domain-containing protein [Ancylobacter rudongensis]
MRVHVVEDDAGVSDSLALILRNIGHTVISHRDAESLFKGSVPEAPDAVIVDLSLPGIPGAQLVRWLLNLAAPPRVVVITGQSQGFIDHQLRGLVPDGVMRKPLDVDAIARVLPPH